MTFRVGDRVVLVDDSGWNDDLALRCQKHGWVRPVKEVVYTIRAIVPSHVCGQRTALLLREIVNDGWPLERPRHEPTFLAHRFRPLIHDTTKAVEAIKASLPRLKQKVMT